MKAFDKLLEITETLQGPKGCPWDKEQTFQSLRPYILEEAHELLEALDEDDTDKMVEELGDVFFQIIFFGTLGKKTGRFTLEEIIKTVSNKLVRRHPHVFGDVQVETTHEVMKHWERIKSEEKKESKHPLEGIPKTLGALARAQKIIDKMERNEMVFPSREGKGSAEEGLGDQFLELVIQAQKDGIDAESALRSALKKYENLFKS